MYEEGNVNVQDSVETTEQLETEEVINETESVDSETPETNDTQTTGSEEVTIPDKISIGDEEYTLDEINEFKQGYLRQSDYTKKTQELARQREEYENAIEMYEYLRDNPYLLDVINTNEDVDPAFREQAFELTPEMQRIKELELRMAQKELDMDIKNLKDKYEDFNEVEVLKEAEQRGISDLEFVYKALREENKVDVDKIKREAVEEAKKEIMAEIKSNKDVTKTLIKDEKEKSTNPTVELTPSQIRVAEGMGLSKEEYAKWLVK